MSALVKIIKFFATNDLELLIAMSARLIFCSFGFGLGGLVWGGFNFELFCEPGALSVIICTSAQLKNS